MRTVRFDPKDLTDEQEKAWWSKWQERANQARKDVLESWERWLASDPAKRKPFKPPLEQKIWKDLKTWLLTNVFHERCAYCESPLEFDRYLGDAEHYRPKGSVTWKQDLTRPKVKARCTLADGSEIEHPGYFWLAYDWRNLVPACSACNSGAGKVDQFPVKRAHLLQLDIAELAGEPEAHMCEPEAIEVPKSSSRYFLGPLILDTRELPLLLNPLNPADDRDPARHLRYGQGGVVVAIDNSEIGENSMRVYRLERDRLRQRRQKAQEMARREYYSEMMQPPGRKRDDKVKKILSRYRTGREDFSSAALDHLRADQQRQIPI
jgi:hypothetical protein